MFDPLSLVVGLAIGTVRLSLYDSFQRGDSFKETAKNIGLGFVVEPLYVINRARQHFEKKAEKAKKEGRLTAKEAEKIVERQLASRHRVDNKSVPLVAS